MLHFQNLPVQGQLQLVHIIGKQGLALFHIVAFLYQQLRNGLVSVFLDLRHVFGDHQARKTVPGGDAAHAGQNFYRLNIYSSPGGTSGQHEGQNQR